MIGDRLNPRQIWSIRKWGTFVMLTLFTIGVFLPYFDKPLRWWAISLSTVILAMTVTWVCGVVLYDIQEEERIRKLRSCGKNISFATPLAYPLKQIVFPRKSRYEREWVI